MRFELTSFALLELVSLVSAQTVTLLMGVADGFNSSAEGLDIQLFVIGTNVALTETTYLEKVGFTRTLTLAKTPSLSTTTFTATGTVIDSPVTQIALAAGDIFFSVQPYGSGKVPGAGCIGNDNGFGQPETFTSVSAVATVIVQPAAATSSSKAAGKNGALGPDTSLALVFTALVVSIFTLA